MQKDVSGARKSDPAMGAPDVGSQLSAVHGALLLVD